MNAVLACILVLAADDWAQFQGPRGDGTSPERGLARAWPAGGPPVLWRAPVKMGWGCPSIAGDDAVVAWTEQGNGGSETVACLDVADGREKWRHTYEVGPYWKRNIGWARGGVRATPVVDALRVYVLGAIGHLTALDRRTGKVVWSRNLWDEWNPSGEKGYCFSPLLAGGKLVLYYGDGSWPAGAAPESGRHVLCRALDPETGKTLWTFQEPHLEPRRMGEGQSPAIAEIGGRLCAVFTGNGCLIALAVEDGAPVWRFECIRRDGRGTTIPTPLVMERQIVNVPDLDETHAVALDRARPDAPSAFAWRTKIHVFTAIHMFRPRDGFLYGFAGAVEGSSEQAASRSVLSLVCLEAATGKLRWTEPGFRNGISIIEADGLLFLRSFQTLHLVEASPEGFRRRGELQIHEEQRATVNLIDMVCPVLSRGRLYVRLPEELVCYDVAAK